MYDLNLKVQCEGRRGIYRQNGIRYNKSVFFDVESAENENCGFVNSE